MADLAFCHVCTLGPDIDLHAVFEVGLITRDWSGDEEKRWWLPVEGLAFADRRWPDLERFFDEHPRGIAKAESKIASELGLADMESFARGFVALTRKTMLVCSPFTEERIRKIVRSQGLVPAWGRLVDPDSLGMGYSAKTPDLGAYAPQGSWGRALDGAKFAREVYDAVTGT